VKGISIESFVSDLLFIGNDGAIQRAGFVYGEGDKTVTYNAM
jgi:hypothetical protein